MSGIWAVVPVKDFRRAKSRLGGVLPAEARRDLARAMCEDVLAALAASPGLAGVAVVTVDAEAIALASRYGVRVIADGADGGHTGAVTAGARLLAAEGADGILTLPGDVPCVTPGEIACVLAAHRPAPAFTIVPAHDRRGSNAILMSPPGVVPLAFGDDSFLPHLAAARQLRITPTIVELAGIGLDIDFPADLPRLAALPATTRVQALMAGSAWRARLDASAA